MLAQWPAPSNVVAGTTTRHGGEADLPATPQYLTQVHGKQVVQLGSSVLTGAEPEADAVFGNRPGDLCVVRTADCLPILLCAADGSEIAAVHAGWRGLAAGVIDATLHCLTTKPPKLLAWIGPAITQSAFEVGGEVRDAFAAEGFDTEDRFTANPNGRWQADLFGLAADRLQKLGVSGIYGERVCTFENPDRFYSYRRDCQTGRLLSFVFRQ